MKPETRISTSETLDAKPVSHTQVLPVGVCAVQSAGAFITSTLAFSPPLANKPATVSLVGPRALNSGTRNHDLSIWLENQFG